MSVELAVEEVLGGLALAALVLGLPELGPVLGRLRLFLGARLLLAGFAEVDDLGHGSIPSEQKIDGSDDVVALSGGRTNRLVDAASCDGRQPIDSDDMVEVPVTDERAHALDGRQLAGRNERCDHAGIEMMAQSMLQNDNRMAFPAA